MESGDQVSAVLHFLAETRACRWCGTRLRFGDFECPHCGADQEDDLRLWAEQLVGELSRERPRAESTSMGDSAIMAADHRLEEGAMAEKKQVKLPLIWRLHNITCPAHILGIGRSLEPGCRGLKKHMEKQAKS